MIAMQGEEIGEFIAAALERNAATRRPWYDALEGLPRTPVIGDVMLKEFDTLVADATEIGPSLLPYERAMDGSRYVSQQ